jgi:COX assembly protein 2
MHPHLHTEEVQKSCADVVAALDECHARGFLWKVTGNCTDAKYKVNMCLRGLRLEKTRQNREAAKAKREHIKKVWAELDEEKFTEKELREMRAMRELRQEGREEGV